jgi:hypothetical protein
VFFAVDPSRIRRYTLYTTMFRNVVEFESEAAMTTGLFDRYFQLLAGRLPAAEYGVLADPVEDEATAAEMPASGDCLC